MPSDPTTTLLGFIIPPAMVLLCMLIAWRPWATVRYTLHEVDPLTREPRHRLPRGWWGAALGLGLGAIIAHIGIAPKLFLPVDASYEWRFVAAIGITPLAILVALVRFPLWALLPLRLLISAAAIAGVASLRFKNQQWELGEGALRIAALAIAITLFWTMLDILATRLKGATPVIIAFGLCLASAPMLIFEATFASAGNSALALAVSLLPIIVLAWWRKPISIARGGVAVIAIVLGMLWTDAVVWQSGINAWQGAAFLLAPLGAIVCLLPWLRQRRPFLRSALTIGAVALLPTVAVLETLSRVNWREYGIDLPTLRSGGGDAQEDEEPYIW